MALKISRQTGTIAASVAAVLAIAGGGAWALSSGGDSGTSQQQVQPADTVEAVTASPSATDSPSVTASPTDVPTTVVPSTSAPATIQPPATTPAPTSTTSKKAASNVSTPSSEPAPTPTDFNNQNNGGTGTADNGPYPSRGPADPNAPTGDPYPYPSTS